MRILWNDREQECCISLQIKRWKVNKNGLRIPEIQYSIKVYQFAMKRELNLFEKENKFGE